MTRGIRPLLLALLFAPAVLAEETWDLRKIIGRKQPVGEKTRIAEEEKGKIEESLIRDGQPAGGQTRDSAGASTYIDEIEAVGADGEPTRVRRTYESFKDDRGTAVPVEKVVVLMTRTEGPDGKFDFAAAEGSPPLPRPVQNRLRTEAANKTQRLQKGYTEDALNQALLPAEPVASGGTWTLDMAKVAPILGFAEGDFDAPTSTGTGKLEGIEEREGAKHLKTRIELKIMVTRMQGNDLPEPTPVVLTLGFLTRAAGDGPQGELTVTQHLDLTLAPPGAPPGTSVHVVVHNERTEKRTLP